MHKFGEMTERYDILNDLEGYGAEVRKVGFAYKTDFDEHYLLRLHSLPTLKFYVKKDYRTQDKYLIFSGISEASQFDKFFNKVGAGETVGRGYIKLKFLDLGMICYLKLDPKDYHFTQKCA